MRFAPPGRKFKEDVYDFYASFEMGRNELEKEEPGQAENEWSKKLSNMLDKRTQLRSLPNLEEHLNMKSILKKTLKEISVEYYKPLEPHQKKLKFRSKWLHSSQKQKFRGEINKSIQHKLKEKQSQQSGQNESCSNVIFVGKNKVLVKSIVENEKNTWKKNRSGRSHSKRKFSQATRSKRKSINASLGDLKNMSDFSKSSYQRPRTISLIHLSKSHFGEQRRGSRIFKEDIFSPQKKLDEHAHKSFHLKKLKAGNSIEMPLKPGLEILESQAVEGLELKQPPEQTKSLDSILNAKPGKSLKKSTYFDEYNLQQIKVDAGKCRSPGKNNRTESTTNRSKKYPKEIKPQLQTFLINNKQILENFQKWSMNSSKNEEPPEEESEKSNPKIKFDETPKTQNSVNQSNFGMHLGRRVPAEVLIPTEMFMPQKQLYNASEDAKSKDEWSSLRNMETINETNEAMSYQNSNWNSFIDDSKFMGVRSHKRSSSRKLLYKNKTKENMMSQPNINRILETGHSHGEFIEADGEGLSWVFDF